MLATGRYIGEGFDDARLDTLFLAMPVSWKGTLVQYTGRLASPAPRQDRGPDLRLRGSRSPDAAADVRETPAWLSRDRLRERLCAGWVRGTECRVRDHKVMRNTRSVRARQASSAQQGTPRRTGRGSDRRLFQRIRTGHRPVHDDRGQPRVSLRDDRASGVMVTVERVQLTPRDEIVVVCVVPASARPFHSWIFHLPSPRRRVASGSRPIATGCAGARLNWPGDLQALPAYCSCSRIIVRRVACDLATSPEAGRTPAAVLRSRAGGTG